MALNTLSPEQICSLSMSLLKRHSVTSLTDTGQEAETCAIWYPILRDQLLELYNWTFACHRTPLQRLSATPPYQYCYYYAMPADLIMPLEASLDVVEITDSTNPPIATYSTISQDFVWLVEGDRIITDAAAVYLKYNRRIEESGKFSPSFALALAYRIAGTTAYPLTGNDKLAAMLLNMSEGEARRAQARDAQKGTQEPFAHDQTDAWVNSRNPRMRFSEGSWYRIQ